MDFVLAFRSNSEWEECQVFTETSNVTAINDDNLVIVIVIFSKPWNQLYLTWSRLIWPIIQKQVMFTSRAALIILLKYFFLLKKGRRLVFHESLRLLWSNSVIKMKLCLFMSPKTFKSQKWVIFQATWFQTSIYFSNKNWPSPCTPSTSKIIRKQTVIFRSNITFQKLDTQV